MNGCQVWEDNGREACRPPHDSAEPIGTAEDLLLEDERSVLTHRAFHLQLDEPIHFNGVLHRQLLDERLDKTVDDHRAGL